MSTGRDFIGNVKIDRYLKPVLEIIKVITPILSQLKFSPESVTFYIYLLLLPSKPVTVKAWKALAFRSCFRHRSSGED